MTTASRQDKARMAIRGLAMIDELIEDIVKGCEVIPVSEVAQYLRAQPSSSEPFVPIIHFNADGRQVEFYWDDEPAYAESIHDGKGVWIGTKLIGLESRRVVGMNLHNPLGIIKQWLEEQSK